MSIKAIETRYDGYRFRSRLESRWAVFFNTLDLPYEYEPEGFHLPTGPYLPDFWLPTLNTGTWLEVKGPFNPHDLTIVANLAQHSGHPCIYAQGPIEPDSDVTLPEITGYAPDGSLRADFHTIHNLFGPHATQALAAARAARFEHGETPTTRHH